MAAPVDSNSSTVPEVADNQNGIRNNVSSEGSISGRKASVPDTGDIFGMNDLERTTRAHFPQRSFFSAHKTMIIGFAVLAALAGLVAGCSQIPAMQQIVSGTQLTGWQLMAVSVGGATVLVALGLCVKKKCPPQFETPEAPRLFGFGQDPTEELFGQRAAAWQDGIHREMGEQRSSVHQRADSVTQGQQSASGSQPPSHVGEDVGAASAAGRSLDTTQPHEGTGQHDTSYVP